MSFTIDVEADRVHVVLQVPERAPLASLRLRLRLPGGATLGGVTRDGAPYGRVLGDGQTIVLPPASGVVELEASY